MASPSKEEEILIRILEESPLKQWRFEEFVKSTSLTRAVINKWLKRYCEERLLTRVKERGAFPYYTAGGENPIYQSRKRLYALNQLYKSGLINYLLRLETKTVIIFGSIARGDWYKDSDIDIFLFGKQKNVELQRFEIALKRNIELHRFKTKRELKAVKSGLLQNVVNGHVVKGTIQDFVTVASA